MGETPTHHAGPPSPPEAASPRSTGGPNVGESNGTSGGGGGNGGGGASSLAAALEPVLRQVCQGRLSEVQWFRSSWQSGGAATGFATFRVEGADPVRVVVKLPVGPGEFRWTVALGGLPHAADQLDDGPTRGGEEQHGLCEVSPGYACAMGPTPRVFAAGTVIGGYDLAWLVVERLDGTPVSGKLCRESLESMLRAAADWYARAARVRALDGVAAGKVKSEDWDRLLATARESIKSRAIGEQQRWNHLVHQAQRSLPVLLPRWNARPINTWCHGDLHPGNAMLRAGTAGAKAGGPGCVLIDLALVHPGHWVEDAVYLERLYWGRSEALDGVKPVNFLARARRDAGLATPEDYTMLANVRRVLMAASAPAFLAREGHPKYMHAALETLERCLPLAVR